jgi:hypothetical protein
MAKYRKEFLDRGKEIESAVNKGRDNNDKILLFTKTLVSYRTGRETWIGRRLKTLYMVDFAYLVSSLFWVIALVILNDASRWSIVVAAVAFVFLMCFVRASSKFEKDDASYAQAVHR